MRSFTGALCFFAATLPAHAGWDYASYPSAFADVTDHLMGIETPDASLVLRCRDGTARWYFTESEVPMITSASLQHGLVEGAYRLDEGPIVAVPAEFETEGNGLVLQFPADIALLPDIGAAKTRIAVAVLLNHAVVFETHFSVEGVREAAQSLISGCQ